MKSAITKLILALLLPTPFLSAQASLVTATIQSASGGQPYFSGTYQVNLVDASGNPLSVSGYQSQFSGTLSSAGLISLSLFPNAQIQAGSQWNFHVCSAVPKTLNTPQPTPTASCFFLAITITGAGDISSTLNASAPVFYACTQWTGSAWASCGGSSYTLPTQYTHWDIPDGLASNAALPTSGFGAIPTRKNNSGATYTITAIQCTVDAGSATTIAVTDNSGNNLLSGSTCTCSTTVTACTLSGSHTTLASGTWVKWTPVPDGTAQAVTIDLTGTF